MLSCRMRNWSRVCSRHFFEKVKLEEVLEETPKGALREGVEEVLEEEDLQEGKEIAPG